ncbi:MAG TPA: hypothetical protein VGN18_09120 [Jatrophihabitans sp.]|jgi:uncharacterized membrane protein|uniref:hypothetical protein n=1 Tax=Jatrophihabitans sp. TaxID=1932789 RepID=UPI002DF745C7|nr:hypothetical protein [Jatrophihabitans sp.]
MPPRTSTLLRAALAGAASGSRSQAVLAACVLTRPGSTRLDRWLHRPSVRRSVLYGAAGELVGDKLPVAPSRTEPPGLGARLALGAATAGLLATRRGERPALPAVVGLLAAAGTTFAGPPARAAAAARFGSDLPGALTEDVLAVGLAAAATRTGR